MSGPDAAPLSAIFSVLDEQDNHGVALAPPSHPGPWGFPNLATIMAAASQ